ncbi:MAG: tRNA guanosine(34) transglycosylase Tgt [Candidatus Paceibacterota bacterium]
MNEKPVKFKIENKSKNTLARAGVINTPNGDIKTPAFVVVGTKGTVKSLKAEDLTNYVGNQVTLANTYHLFLQPGEKLIAEAGGLHNFTKWKTPTITDSGGFQVFSLGAAFGKGVTKFATEVSTNQVVEGGINVYNKELATEHGKLCIIDEEGVTFTSHIDGSMHRFTAERSIEIQHNIGADIIIAFDECTSPTANYAYQTEAMERTHRWAKRSILAHKQNYQALKKQGLYGVVQGGRFLDLRKKSAETLSAMDFDGFGIGGSFSKSDLFDSLKVVNQTLPEEKPRHLLGIGEPEDIVLGVLNGCDTFDCVNPTRLARTGSIYVKTGKIKTTECGTLSYPEIEKINIKNNKYQKDLSSVDEFDDGYVANNYSKAYLAHLFKANEMLAGHLASIHNLHTIVSFTEHLRLQLLQN